jgi:membrane dipeptidase
MSTSELDSRARRVHDEAIVIDATCPLLQDAAYLDWWIAGGATAVAPTITSVEGAAEATRRIATWLGRLRRDTRLRHITTAAGVEAAKRDGQLGIIFHFQGIGPIEDDLDLVFLYKELGVGMIQLAYNVASRAGAGCEDARDDGLTTFGVALVDRLNEARVVVDCSHTGERTTLEAIARSRAPVVFSHANARALRPSGRTISDEQMRAVAATGGLVGIVGFPAFVCASPRPTLDQFIDLIDYVANLAGIDHVGLGIDYFLGQAGVADDDSARRIYDRAVAGGVWNPANYPPPPYHYPHGIETPRTLSNLTQRLLERGYGAEDCHEVLGGNWLRIFRAVWGG